jgi:hypothetical protein
MRKIKLLLFLVVSIGFQFTYAQEQDTSKVTSARVFMMSDPTIIGGYLYQLNNSTIALSSSALLSSPTVQFNEFDVENIRKIEFKIKTGGGKRLLVGALAGFVAGGIIGFATGGSSDGFVAFSAGESALMAGALGAIAGGLIYASAGSKVGVRINGDKETYFEKNKNLKKHLLVK